MSDEALVIVPIPPLVAVLLHHERAKGEPLTEAEVLEVRDAAVAAARQALVADVFAAATTAGSRRMNDDPAPSSLSSASSPPMRVASACEIASPSPTPGSHAVPALR